MIERININSFLLSFFRNLIYYLKVLFWGQAIVRRNPLSRQRWFSTMRGFRRIVVDPFILIGFNHVERMF